MANKRTHGTGTVFKNARSGVYRYQWTDPITGRKRTASLHTKDRAEAERKAKAYTDTQEATDRQEVVTIIAKDRKLIRSRDLPLADVWTAFEGTNPSASAGTLRNYQRALRDCITWLEENRPSIVSFTQIDDETASAYLAELWRSGITANTYNYRRNAMGCVTKALSGPYHIEANPWTRPELRKAEVKQNRMALTSEQAADLLALFDDPARHIVHQDELRVVALLCLYAGMRLKDACLLQWHDVDLTAGRIVYTPAKTAQKGKSAAVPILPPLRTALAELPGCGTAGDVLPAVADTYLRNPDGIQKPLVALVQEAAGTDGRDRTNEAIQRKVTRSVYGAHSLRHTFATMAAMAGVKPAYLALMLGDNITTIQKYYVHVGFGMTLADGFETIPKMIEAKSVEDPVRVQLHQLADDLPLSAVRQVLAFIKRGQALPPAGNR